MNLLLNIVFVFKFGVVTKRCLDRAIAMRSKGRLWLLYLWSSGGYGTVDRVPGPWSAGSRYRETGVLAFLFPLLLSLFSVGLLFVGISNSQYLSMPYMPTSIDIGIALFVVFSVSRAFFVSRQVEFGRTQVTLTRRLLFWRIVQQSELSECYCALVPVKLYTLRLGLVGWAAVLVTPDQAMVLACTPEKDTCELALKKIAGFKRIKRVECDTTIYALITSPI